MHTAWAEEKPFTCFPSAWSIPFLPFMQMQAEMEELIEGICSTYKDFSQKQADTASLLDCIAAEELQRGSTESEPLPELEEGPDEVLRL